MFIPNPLRFHEKNWNRKSPTKNSLKPEPERIEACRNTVQWEEVINFLLSMYFKGMFAALDI